MKSCLQCGKQAEDWEAECTECGRAFSFHGADSEIEFPTPYSTESRPVGSDLISKGVRYFWVSIVLALLGWFLISNGALQGYGFWQFIAIALPAISSILLPVSGAFWIAGKIVHAISFLPGKDK
jgi:hypothetical protein